MLKEAFSLESPLMIDDWTTSLLDETTEAYVKSNIIRVSVEISMYFFGSFEQAHLMAQLGHHSFVWGKS